MNQLNAPQDSQQKNATESGQLYQHRNRTVFVPDGYIAVGRVATAHGLRGEVRVELHTDFPERFQSDLSLFVGEDLSEMEIQFARPHKKMMLVKLAGINNRNAAEALRDKWLFVAEEDAVELEDDTYWVHDIIGMTVQTEEEEVLGVITDVLFTGANDVYIIDGRDVATSPRELLLPAIADVVQRVEPDKQRMTVRLLPGLIP